MKPAIWARRLPWSIVVLALVLMGLGWLGIARSQQLAETDGGLLRRQFVWSLLGMGAMLLVTIPNYRVLCRFSYALLGLTVMLLAAAHCFPPIHGAHRWIRVGPVGVQPSELAKVAFVLALARYLMYRENHRRLAGLLPPVFLTLVPVLLILSAPDLGTAAVFLPVLLLMLLAAGARIRHLGFALLAGLMTLPLCWVQMSSAQRSRVTALFEQTEPGDPVTRDGYHLYRAKQMLALGGAWGSYFSGDATADQGACRVPEPATDSIFVVLGERFGQIGVAAILSLYALLIWRGLRVADGTREPFGRLVATGVVALIGVQVVINTGMMVGLLPITGLSLPLVSYGGSGLLAHSIALGLVLSIGMRPGYEVTRDPFRYADG